MISPWLRHVLMEKPKTRTNHIGLYASVNEVRDVLSCCGNMWNGAYLRPYEKSPPSPRSSPSRIVNKVTHVTRSSSIEMWVNHNHFKKRKFLWFWAILVIKKIGKIHKIGNFGCKNSRVCCEKNVPNVFLHNVF